MRRMSTGSTLRRADGPYGRQEARVIVSGGRYVCPGRPYFCLFFERNSDVTSVGHVNVNGK